MGDAAGKARPLSEKDVFSLSQNDLEALLDYAPNSTDPSGVVSKVTLPAGSLFVPITTATETNTKRWSSVQTGKNTHIELNSALQYMNHSCKPTLELDTSKMEVRVSRQRDLQVGDELNFFYPSSEWHMAGPFQCDCGAGSDCLGLISGASRMNLEQLKARGYFFNKHIEDLMVLRN